MKHISKTVQRHPEAVRVLRDDCVHTGGKQEPNGPGGQVGGRGREALTRRQTQAHRRRHRGLNRSKI